MTDTLERSESDVSRPRPRRRARRWRSVLLTVVFVIGGFVVTGVLPVREYLERGNDVEAARIELDRLRAENNVLADDIDALYTEQEVERIAREQYGFVREGEVGYVVITPEREEPVAEPAPPVPSVTEERSFLQRIWDFVTGNDQTNDG
ncbi:MAG: septum formation initiator family protein [Acidimicrobiia bacterium]